MPCGMDRNLTSYGSTGIRVRDYPITLDKLLDRRPPVS